MFTPTTTPEKYYDDNGDIMGWVVPDLHSTNLGFLNDKLEFQVETTAGWLNNGHYFTTTIFCNSYADAHSRANKYYEKHGQDYPWERHSDAFGEFWTKPKSITNPRSTTIQSEEMKF